MSSFREQMERFHYSERIELSDTLLLYRYYEIKRQVELNLRTDDITLALYVHELEYRGLKYRELKYE